MKEPSKKRRIEEWIRNCHEKKIQFPTAEEIASKFGITYRYANVVLAELMEEFKP